MDSFLNRQELQHMGFQAYGEDVKISRRAVFYSPEMIELGNHVRIDDFCFISGGKGIEIGNYVHIAAYSALYGKNGIRIGNYVNISGRVNIYSTSDDYSGEYMTGPLVEAAYIHDIGKEIEIKDFVIIGAGSILLPGTLLGEGVAIGAMSLVKTKVPDYQIFAGIPARYMKERSKGMLQYLQEESGR